MVALDRLAIGAGSHGVLCKPSIEGLRAEGDGRLHQQRAVVQVAHLEERQLAAEIPGVADRDEDHASCRRRH